MTTEDEARTILTHLHRLAHTLDQAVLDSGMPAPSGDNAGCAPVGPKSKLPCSTNLLDQQADLTTRIQPICANLATDLTIGGRPFGEPELAPWIWWLHRHRIDLINRDWWPEAMDELLLIHRELADQFEPPESNRPKLPDFATAEELASATGKTVAAMYKWCQRNRVESFTIDGVKHYKTTSVIDH